MTFAELKTELAARGFDYLSSTRLAAFINDAMHELDDEDMWPYRYKTTSGTAPLTVTDLGTVLMVVDETNDVPLTPTTELLLTEQFGDISLTGDPEFWYLTYSSGSPVINVYPINTTITLGVRYLYVRSSLSAESDEPIAPSRFHNIIMDIAVRMAYNDSDNPGSAQGIQVEIDRKLGRMRGALLGGQQAQGPSGYAHLTYSSADY